MDRLVRVAAALVHRAARNHATAHVLDPVRALHRDGAMRRSLFLLALALPGFGYTDCQYFSQVPISTTETSPPTVGVRLWVDGREAIRPGDSLTYSSTGDILVAPFVFDSGGAWMLQLRGQTVEVLCHDDDADPEESQATTMYLVDKSDSQVQAPAGTMRSNGIYNVSDISDLSSYAWYCYDGFDLETITYRWEVWGRDFSGNEATAGGTIVYAP